LDGAAGSISESPASSEAFVAAFRWIVEAEGGDTLVTDTGGLTRWGVSRRAHPDVDIENLTREQAKRIYWDDYWRPISGDSLPKALALVVFDAAVNQGVPQAVKILQTVLRGVAVDGVVGRETIAAARAFLPRGELVAQALELRLRWYQDLVDRDEGTRAKYGRYLHGWRMRVLRLALEAGSWGSA